MVAFASGGRRSEVAGVRREQIAVKEPITTKTGLPSSSLSIHLSAHQDKSGDRDEMVYLTGRQVEALNVCL